MEGEVITSVVKAKDQVSMTIKDNGVGMDLERINSIMKKELQKFKQWNIR